MTPLRSYRGRLGAHGAVALVAFAAAIIAFLVSARQLIPAIFMPAPEVTTAPDSIQHAQQYALAIDEHIKQFDGRSLFFIPSRPLPPPPPPRLQEDPGPPPPPPPPSRYGGPSLIAMMNDTVWFDDGAKLKSGESSTAVRVVRIDAPWSATLEWKGVEFTVGLFERDKVVMPAPQPAPAATVDPESSPQEPEASALTSGDPPATETQSPDHASKE
jgi:hypothetical protein